MLKIKINKRDKDNERWVSIEGFTGNNKTKPKTRYFEAEGYLNFKDFEKIAAEFDRIVRSW